MKLFLFGLLGATLGAKFDDQESDWTVSLQYKNGVNSWNAKNRQNFIVLKKFRISRIYTRNTF